MRFGVRCLSRLLLAGLTLGVGIAASAPDALAAPGYGDCTTDAADRELGSSGAYDELDARLGSVFAPTGETFWVQQAFCRDLTGDGAAELVALLGCCTVSSPTPWAILQRGADGRGRVAFLTASANYVRRLRVGSLNGRPVIVERRQVVTRYDANCCPTGGTLIRRIGLNDNGAFAVLQRSRLPHRGYRNCGIVHSRWVNIRARRTTCGTARAVVRGYARRRPDTTGYVRLRRPRGWRCRRVGGPSRFFCKRSGRRAYVRFEAGLRF